MKTTDSVLRSSPPVMVNYLIYTGAVIFLILSAITLLNVNELVGSWFIDVEAGWASVAELSK